MGAIVSADMHAVGRVRPASVTSAAAPPQDGAAGPADRPDSAPAALVLAAAREVEVARREASLRRVDHARAGRARVGAAGLSHEQLLRLELKAGEALVEQVLHEGRELLSALPSPHTRDVLQALEGSEAPVASVIRMLRDRQADAAPPPRQRLQSAASAASAAWSVSSDSSEVERMRARQTKRGVTGRERHARPWSWRSEASNPDEKYLERTAVVQQVLDKESSEGICFTADALALLSKRRADDAATRDAARKIQRFLATQLDKRAQARKEAEQARRKEEEDAARRIQRFLAKLLAKRAQARKAAEQARREEEELSMNATLTAAELDEAEQIVADVVESDSRELVEQAACEQRLDDILREGELLLQLLPDSDARALLQIIDYTPRVDAETRAHAHSSNNNPVVSALRSQVYNAEEDALLQAEALLAVQSSDAEVQDRGNADEDVDALLTEGASLLSLPPASDADEVVADMQCAVSPIAKALASPDAIRRKYIDESFTLDSSHATSPIKVILPYLESPGQEGTDAESQQAQVAGRPTTAHCNAIMDAGGEGLVRIFSESERLLGALPSPHARSLLQDFETAKNPVAGALRTFHNRQDIVRAAVSYFGADSDARHDGDNGALVACDAMDRPVVEDGLARMIPGTHHFAADKLQSRGADAALSDPVFVRDETGHLVLKLRTSTQTEMDIIKSISMADGEAQVVEEWRRQTIDSSAQASAPVVKETVRLRSCGFAISLANVCGEYCVWRCGALTVRTRACADGSARRGRGRCRYSHATLSDRRGTHVGMAPDDKRGG